MIIWSSINCPTVIRLPTIGYFYREKPLVKTTAPGSLLRIIFLCDLFSIAFIFRPTKPKNTKIPCCNLFLFILFGVWSINLLQFIHVCFANFWRRYPKGIDNPFNTSSCEDLLSVCRGCLRCVAWFSYWFNNLVFISEGNVDTSPTYL